MTSWVLLILFALSFPFRNKDKDHFNLGLRLKSMIDIAVNTFKIYVSIMLWYTEDKSVIRH